MGRNRKNGSAVRFVPAIKAALICLLLGGSAIGYVYQKNQIFDLGRQIQKSEYRLRVLRENNAKLQKTLLTMQSATQLEKRVRELTEMAAIPREQLETRRSIDRFTSAGAEQDEAGKEWFFVFSVAPRF